MLIFTIVSQKHPSHEILFFGRMKQSPTAISHEQLSPETWKDEMVSELLSYESSVGDTEDMMLPLDLCINRNGK